MTATMRVGNADTSEAAKRHPHPRPTPCCHPATHPAPWCESELRMAKLDEQKPATQSGTGGEWGVAPQLRMTEPQLVCRGGYGCVRKPLLAVS